MQEEEKFVPSGDSDMERLLSAMEHLKNRSFQSVDDAAFEDPEIAKAFNGMLKSLMDHNNHFLMRINDAMMRIADNSCVKNTIEQVHSQEKPIRELQEVGSWMHIFMQQNDELQMEVLALAKQAQNSILPCARKLREGENLLEESAETIGVLSTEIQALKEQILERLPKGKRGGGIAESLDELTEVCDLAKSNELHILQTVKAASEQVDGISDRLKVIRGDMNRVYMGILENNEKFSSFPLNLQSITDSYEVLSKECFSTGSHLYRISRDIDNARNDMYRHNSRPTMHDRISIFGVDHLTLVWRLYNNIIEYETLKITQLNNPDRCKFGLWWASVTDPRITESVAFKKVYDTHEKLHEHAVSSFLAKEGSDDAEAIREFELALAAFQEFYEALQDLHRHFRGIGIIEETEVWKFRG